MEQPVCNLQSCGEPIEDEETFIQLGGGTVYRSELQSDAGGGIFHPECAKEYIQNVYIDME